MVGHKYILLLIVVWRFENFFVLHTNEQVPSSSPNFTNNINKIMALGEEGYYSNDGAATWAKKMDVFTTYKSRQTYVHSDHHFAEFIDDTTVLVGHDGGVSLINTKADPFGHTDITGNMIISQIYHSAIYNADKNNENLLLGTQDNGGFSKSPSTN